MKKQKVYILKQNNEFLVPQAFLGVPTALDWLRMNGLRPGDYKFHVYTMRS